MYAPGWKGSKAPDTHGWLVASAIWFVLQNVLLAFVLTYALAGLDHHAAERIPTHLHLGEAGQGAPQHTHGFDRAHQHDHAFAAAAGSANAFPSVTAAAPSPLPQPWSGDLGLSDMPALLLLGPPMAAGVLVGAMAHQLLRAPLLRPPGRIPGIA
ncbi:MAG: hypothetical protein HY534_05330 [Chloroflexi bacterium]|nr:hypothetical protein [Chloroflexota bacterium]